MGCERSDLLEALSDNLLALRAMLEPEGPSSGMLPGRLAALCATPERRLSLAERAVQAIALERATIAGTGRDQAGARMLTEEIADHLRALLRDVICGHLDPDLVGLADELLLADRAEAVAVEASRRERERPSESELLGDPAQAEEILDLII
jgi:glyoxylase-like metal-dependent hydrolase (beta-lactamase superfamily II)